MMTTNAPVFNPYVKPRPAAAHNEANKGRQSQQRISNQHKRKHKLCSNNNNKKRKKGDQLTLLGGTAFEAQKDCVVCKARFLATFVEGHRAPNRAHHPLCIRNTKTRGKGELSELQKATLEDNKRYKALVRPITAAEKGSSRNLPADSGAAFFAPRAKTPPPKMIVGAALANDSDEVLSPSYFCQAVSKLVLDDEFIQRHKDKRAPLAMMAFADEVANTIIRQKRSHEFFGKQLTMEVPDCDEAYNNPHYHSVVGQKTMLVEWERSHGIEVPCPDATCQGHLGNDRTNYSKNKTLFPTCDLNGPPTWCVVMTVVCGKCRRRSDANEGEVLVSLPECAANQHPVHSSWAFPNFASHLSRTTAEAFSSLTLTCGNGEMCSRMLCNSINVAYLQRIKSYCSHAKEKKLKVKDCVTKDGVFVKAYPPLGDTVRDMFD